MAPAAGFSGAVRIGGTPVSSSGEATTNIDGGAYKQYQVTEPTHRISWVPSGLTVKKNGTPVAASAYTYDPLFGVVSFASALLNTDVVTVDLYYVPTTAIAYGKEVSVKESADMLDVTSFDSGGAKDRIAGLKSATVTLNQVVPTSDEFTEDTSLDVLFDGRALLLVEWQPDANQHALFRMFALLDSVTSKAAVAAIVEGEAELQSATLRDATTGVSLALNSFGWGTDN